MGRGGGRALTLPSVPERQRRAEVLAQRYPHAAEPLGFYVDLLHLQEPLCYHPRIPAWLAMVDSGGGAGTPLLRLDRFPVHEVEDDQKRFWEDSAPFMTPVLEPIARRLALDPELANRFLLGFLAGESLDAPHGVSRTETGATEPELAFFPHAFIQPVIERLAVLAAEGEPTRPSDAPTGSASGAATTCPACGRAPIVGTLGDEPGSRGRRRLICSLCGTAWPFRRLTCVACGETDAERLAHHVSQSWPHVRVDECRACGTYAKTIDLRAAGDAVPVVDELGSVALDLWADERGLKKWRRNLLGF